MPALPAAPRLAHGASQPAAISSMSHTRSARASQQLTSGSCTQTRYPNPMGNGNVERLLWAVPPITDIPSQTRWCLLLMAKRAHDEDPRYYGGLTHLMLNLGYSVDASGRRAVMRHLAKLQAAGYVTHTGKREGHRTVYELHLPGSR